MRDKIIQDANSCLGVPFHHQGRSEFGLDCAGLIVYILKMNGLYEEGCDIKAYSRLPSGNDIAKLMNKYFDKTNIEEALNGDILLFRFENNPQHLAWLEITEDGTKNMIHAYGVVSVNKVVKNILDEKWLNKLVCVYRVKNIDKEEYKIEYKESKYKRVDSYSESSLDLTKEEIDNILYFDLLDGEKE